MAGVAGDASRAARRTREILRDEGASGLWLRGLDATVFRRMILLARPLSAAPSQRPSERPTGVEYSFLRPDEVAEYSALRPDTPAAETARRLAAGHRCLVGRLDGVVVHARWISIERLESAYLGFWFELGPTTAYVGDAFTAAAARRTGISLEATAHYREALEREGVRTVLAAVWPNNIAGSGYVHTIGQRRIGTLATLRLGPARIPLRRGALDAHLGHARRFRP